MVLDAVDQNEPVMRYLLAARVVVSMERQEASAPRTVKFLGARPTTVKRASTRVKAPSTLLDADRCQEVTKC